MADSDTFDRLRAAFKKTQSGTDGQYTLKESSAGIGIKGIKQLHVIYTGGNEYLRLDTLLESLRDIGTVKVFELRGRSADEQPRLVADIDVAGEVFQLIYHLS